jgi:NADH-quinone oxidoreductase subunit H
MNWPLVAAIDVGDTTGGVLRLIFPDQPGLLLRLGWSVAIVGVIFMGMVSVVGFLGIWAERKVAGRIQHRHGPNRVGPIGILQSLADGIKLVGKEDLAPRGADRWLFRLAPYLAFAPVFAAFLAIPFGPLLVFEPTLSAGVFWMIAILSVEVIGVILAGWASNNKWSTYGAMREACQLISYEIPLGLAILTVVVAAGTLNLIELTHLQLGGANHWLIFHQPFVAMAFGVFFVASLASNKRAPFDLPESESELVAGYHTEYSGLRFSLFYLAEYNAMFVMAAIMSVLFLGGWDDPFGFLSRWQASIATDRLSLEMILLNLSAAGVFVLKTCLLIFVQMWVRWTLPRPRIDQVLHVCFKVIMPLSLAMLLGSAVWELLVTDGSLMQKLTQWTLLAIGAGVVGLLGLMLLQAFAEGRGAKQRLVEPSKAGA